MKTTIERLRNVISFTEIESMKYITAELGEKNEGIIIASKAVSKGKITRSVAVNAMKLLEVAGVIETRSLGMKGTFIKVLDRNTLDELIA